MALIYVKAFGLPLEIAALVGGIYRVIDMGNTTLNVGSDLVGTVIVAHSEGVESVGLRRGARITGARVRSERPSRRSVLCEGQIALASEFRDAAALYLTFGREPHLLPPDCSGGPELG